MSILMLKKREYIFKNSQTNVLITNPRRSLKLPSCHFWDPVHGIFGFIHVWKREIHSLSLSLSLNFANKRNPPKFSFSLSLCHLSLSILLIKRNPPKFSLSLSHLLKISYFSLSPTLFTFLK